MCAGLYDFIDEPLARPTINVNGRPYAWSCSADTCMSIANGSNGDRIELHLPMPIRQVRANSSGAERIATVWRCSAVRWFLSGVVG